MADYSKTTWNIGDLISAVKLNNLEDQYDTAKEEYQAGNWGGITITIGLNFIIDGGGVAITTGKKGHLEVPFSMTITGWTILADQSGSIVVDVNKSTYSGFPSTASIAGSELPTLSSAQKNQDLTLSTWTTAVTAGDILEFEVDSVSTVTRVTVAIRGTRSA